MNEEYAVAKKKILKRMVLILVVLSVTLGVITYIGISNDKKQAEGPKDLTSLDISKSKGEFVEAAFDELYYLGEYYTEYTDKDITVTDAKVYYSMVNEKLLMIEVPSHECREFDDLVNLCENELPVENPIHCKGLMISMESDIKNYTKDLLEEELKIEKMGEEEFKEYFWPYIMQTDIAEEIGEDNTDKIIKGAVGIYLFLLLTVIMTTFSNIARLRR